MSPDLEKENHQMIADDADYNFYLTGEEIEQIELRPESCFWVFKRHQSSKTQRTKIVAKLISFSQNGQLHI